MSTSTANHGQGAPALRARVVVESADGRRFEMESALGVSLLEVSDEHAGPIPFCCRSASCGTCRVEVVEGGERLSAPAADELDVLEMYGESPQRVRLACQARVCRGDGVVRLRAIEP